MKRGIYGLKQAAKVWNEQVDDLLKKDGFRQSQTDSCLYIKNNGGEQIYFIVYVDDILIASKNTRSRIGGGFF